MRECGSDNVAVSRSSPVFIRPRERSAPLSFFVCSLSRAWRTEVFETSPRRVFLHC